MPYGAGSVQVYRAARCTARVARTWSATAPTSAEDPPGTLVARSYCPSAHCTFSLLPDHLAARFPGTLSEIEDVVAAAEAAPSRACAAEALRPELLDLPSAVRWIDRRVRLVRAVLISVVSLLPHLLLGCEPSISALRVHLGYAPVLVRLRGTTAEHLHTLARPLGFRPPRGSGGGRKRGCQQQMGPDPPAPQQ